MVRRNYSDDDDFYTQGFEKKGVVSVWLGMEGELAEKNIDTLQDLCGVGYYRLSDQEGKCFNFELANVSRFLVNLSYSSSFREAVVSEAKKRGIEEARWAVVQYDFAYDPARVTRKIENDPLFIGVFSYSDEE